MCSHPMSVPKCRGRCPSGCSCKWPSEKNNTCLSCFTYFAWEEPTWPSECIRMSDPWQNHDGFTKWEPLLAIEYHLVCFLSPPTSYSDFPDLSVQSMETADCVCIIHTASYGTWGHCRQTWWDPKSLKGAKATNPIVTWCLPSKSSNEAHHSSPVHPHWRWHGDSTSTKGTSKVAMLRSKFYSDSTAFPWPYRFSNSNPPPWGLQFLPGNVQRTAVSVSKSWMAALTTLQGRWEEHLYLWITS